MSEAHAVAHLVNKGGLHDKIEGRLLSKRSVEEWAECLPLTPM